MPPFSEYEAIFSDSLPITWFSAYAVPNIASDPLRVVTLASIIYGHWKSRRMERNGNRIFAQLNVSRITIFNLGLHAIIGG